MNITLNKEQLEILEEIKTLTLSSEIGPSSYKERNELIKSLSVYFTGTLYKDIFSRSKK